VSQKIAQLYCEEILHIQTQIASEDGSYIIETKWRYRPISPIPWWAACYCKLCQATVPVPVIISEFSNHPKSDYWVHLVEVQVRRPRSC